MAGKRGRPPLDADERRSERVVVLVRPREKEQLEMAAQSASTPLQEWARQLLLKRVKQR